MSSERSGDFGDIRGGAGKNGVLIIAEKLFTDFGMIGVIIADALRITHDHKKISVLK